MSDYYNILLPVATGGIYTYSSVCQISKGVRVKVPFGKRTATGICIGKTEKPDFECRQITAVIDDEPIFGEKWLSFINKISSYYMCPLGLTFHGVISSKILDSSPPDTYPYAGTVEVEDIELTAEQMDIVKKIPLSKYSTHLLNGITGSGKTEIYLYLARQVLNEGKKVIYLVPEISLTHQLIQRVGKRLGFEPGIFHSKLTAKQRTNGFWSFAKGNVNFMIGPRSALFIPVENPGLVIIDEEHESTYKQDESPSYNLRDMGVLYGSLYNIPVILGSATPQVESYANTISGKYVLHNLKNRTGGAVLPTINLVNAREHNLAGGILADPVYTKLYQTIQNGKQAIIFLNRKGYATTLYCNHCGALQECRNCSVALTMYKDGTSVCHYCGEKYRQRGCNVCGSPDIKDTGAGTERVEEFIDSMFPGQTVRIDAGTVSSVKKLETALNNFAEKKASIMVGTQIVAKGLHFPDVTFVGILGIDNILAMPDFRATEKAYQLLMQVSGRAGRGEEHGEVYIQTYLPENPLFDIVINDPGAYYSYELERRKLTLYPPYAKMARLIFSYSKEDIVQRVSQEVCSELEAMFNDCLSIQGPAQAVIYKIKNIYRYSAILKTFTGKDMAKVLTAASELFKKHAVGTFHMKVDRDPYFFM